MVTAAHVIRRTVWVAVILGLVGCGGEQRRPRPAPWPGPGGQPWAQPWPAAPPPTQGHPAPPASVPPPAAATRTKQWALQVLLGPEYGGAGKVCSRFARPVTLSVMRGTAAERVHVPQVVWVLDQQLRTAGSSLTLVGDGDPHAAIEVYFVNHAEFTAIGKSKGFPIHGVNYGYFWTFWDTAHRITKAYVLIAKDKLSGARLQHFTFEEITQSLGLSNDSPLFTDSVFFAKDGKGGSAPTLSALDQKLVRFFYRHVAPGSRLPQLEAAFDAWWAATP